MWPELRKWDFVYLYISDPLFYYLKISQHIILVFLLIRSQDGYLISDILKGREENTKYGDISEPEDLDDILHSEESGGIFEIVKEEISNEGEISIERYLHFLFNIRST